MVKNLPANAGDARDVTSILGLERALAEGSGKPTNGHPLQYSCLKTSWTEELGGLRSVGLQLTCARKLIKKNEAKQQDGASKLSHLGMAHW